MRSYLLAFDPNATSRDTIVSCIDAVPEIHNWMLFFDNAACIVSDSSPRELASLIRERLPKAHFILTAMEPGTRAGWLRKSVWDFIRNPTMVEN